MIGFEGKARGEFGVKEVKAWSEGKTGLTKAVEGFTQQAINTIRSTEANFGLYLTIDNKTFHMKINSDTTADQLTNFLKQAGCGENVVGFIVRAITNHCNAGIADGGVRSALIIDIKT